MKRMMLWTLPVALLLAGMALVPEELPDVVLTRGEHVENYRTTDRTPEGLFKLIESVVENRAQPGDDVRFRGFARNTKADQLRLHQGTFGGFGPEQSKLTVVNRIDVPKSTPGIIPSMDSTIADCTIVNDCYDKNEDGGGIGWALEKQPLDPKLVRKLTLRNVVIDGRTNGDWLVYAWDDNHSGVNVTIEGCEFFFPRQAVSLCNSAAKNQVLTIRDTKFRGNANWSHSYGETSSADPDTGVLVPIVFRSGTATIERCEFWVAGWKSPDGAPYSANGKYAINRVVGIVTDQYFSPISAGYGPTVTIRDSIVHSLEPNGAKVVKPIADMRYGTATMDNRALVAKLKAAQDSTLKSVQATIQNAINDGRAAVDQAAADVQAAMTDLDADGTKTWKPEK
jgi:hypothetical protein